MTKRLADVVAENSSLPYIDKKQFSTDKMSSSKLPSNTLKADSQVGRPDGF